MNHNKLPPELYKLILNQLDNLSVFSILDYINILKENTNTILSELILDRLCFISLISDKNSTVDVNKWSHLGPIIENAYTIDIDSANDGGVISPLTITKESIKKIIFIIDENIILPSDFNWEQHIIIESSNKKSIQFDVLLCAYSNIELRAKKSLVENAVSFLSQLPEWLSSSFSNHLMIEFDNDGKDVDSGSELFGIFSPNMASHYEATHNVYLKQITFLNLRKLYIRYTTIDTYIFNIFSFCLKEQYNIVHLNAPTPQSIFKNYLTNLNVNCPILKNITFRESIIPAGDDHPVTIEKYVEKCNFIDLTRNALEKFKSNNVNLRFLFQIHSFKNWTMPMIRLFTGHRFKFDATSKITPNSTLTLDPLKINLALLKEIILDETRDASPYFRLNLIPEGVEKSRIINWAPLEHDSNSDSLNSSKSPILFLKCITLKFLEIKPLIKENVTLIIIQGLYLPSLKEITFYEQKANLITNQKRFNEYKLKGSISVAFSSWNDIDNLEMIKVPTDSEFFIPYNFVFDIANLKRLLPKLSLENSFENFVDEKQKFIVA